MQLIMRELTKKLLALDSQADEELKLSNKLAQEMMLKADTHAKEMISEAQKLFEKQKENDLKTLFQKVDQKRLHGEKVLKENMQDFDKHFDIDTLVKELILVAKEKVCP